MLTPEKLADWFGLNLRIVKMQTEGLSHADSLLQPPVRGNCLNWVLGHILFYRNDVLRALGQAPVEGNLERYETGSEPITCEGEGVMSLEKLVEALEESQERITQGLRDVTDEDLQRTIVDGGRTFPLAEYLFGLYFHDTYHVGQTELLRQLSGVGDSVI